MTLDWDDRMGVETSTVRLLGAAQLIVFAASMISERLLVTAVGTGPASSILVNVSKSLTRLRISNLVALLNSLAIIVLLADDAMRPGGRGSGWCPGGSDARRRTLLEDRIEANKGLKKGKASSGGRTPERPRR